MQLAIKTVPISRIAFRFLAGRDWGDFDQNSDLGLIWQKYNFFDFEKAK